MGSQELNSSEITNYAAEILNWDSPRLLTEGDLEKIKSVAGSAVTQTHDYLQNQCGRIVRKPNVGISDIIKYNQYLRNKE